MGRDGRGRRYARRAAGARSPQDRDRRPEPARFEAAVSRRGRIAAELLFAQAEALVRQAIDSSRSLARNAIASVLQELTSQGHDTAGCAVLLASGKPLPDLAAILASHPLIHTAEGELFREALLWAARECGLDAIGVREKSLDAEVLRRLDPLGKSLGPPWTQDEKRAAAAALMALG
jgi:hypothetical protein